MEEALIMNSGERIKSIRKELGVKQEELAGEKFSKNYISMFENNKRKINAINASYLADRMNQLAKEKRKDIFITAAYLLKTESDLAQDRCHQWLEKVETNPHLTQYEILSYLSRAIHVALKYELWSFYGRALYLMGLDAHKRQVYRCAQTHFLEALNYFLKLDLPQSVIECYKWMGVTLYKEKHYDEAIVYFNLSEKTLKSSQHYDENVLEEIKYHKALIHCDLEQYDMALRIIGKINTSNMKLLQLASKINHAIAG